MEEIQTTTKKEEIVLENPAVKIEFSNKAGQTYQKLFETYLKHTNAYGNIYYSNYFDFAGALREGFYVESICERDPVKVQSYMFATHEASMKYHVDGHPFDVILGTLNTAHIGHTSTELVIRFYNASNSQLLCEGKQTIAIVNSQTHGLDKTPAWMLDKLKEYEIR
jgi:acyl-CoA thioesterase FadM